MEDESEQLRAILDKLPAAPSDPWANLLCEAELEPDPSLPLRDALADWLAARGRWPGEPNSGRVGGCRHEYPQVIRVADLRLRDQPFRVLRCAECSGRMGAHRIPEEMFSEHFILWPLTGSESEIEAFAAEFQPSVRLLGRLGSGAADRP